jgi:predicted PurR-regulated permease PerM
VHLVDLLRNLVNWIVAHGRGAVVGAFGLFASLSLMLFLLFFFFRDGDEAIASVIGLVPLDRARKERLGRRLSDVTRAVVNGTVVTALVQGVLVGVGFWIVGLPSPIVFGALTAVASFIPIVGTGLVLGPAVIFLATAGVWWKTIFLLAWGVLVAGSADNLLRPLLISGRSSIGTLAAFVGAIGGLAAFGLVGLFLGPVIVALVLALIEFAQEAIAKEQAGRTA